jgi:hypothetical protein
MVPTYDPKLVILSLGEIIFSGYADGTMIQAARDGDSFTKHVGADGEVSRTRNRNRSGAVTVTLKQTSLTNDALSALLAADELLGTGIRPLRLRDMSGTTLLASDRAWLRKPADAEFGKDQSDRQWIIECATLAGNVGGVPAL